MNLIGHKKERELLDRLIKTGRLGQAVLFVGPDGVGKRTLAEQVIQTIGIKDNHENQGIKDKNTIDLTVIARERNDKDELKKSISIEQVRKLIERLHLTSFSGGVKVGLVDGAEWLTTESSNALLKTLEDPAGDTLVILLATSTVSIPQTILSRCQVIHLSSVPNAELIEGLMAEGVPENEVQEVIEAAAGRPGVAKRILADPEFRSRLQENEERLNRLVGSSLPQTLGEIQTLGKLSREETEEMLDTWETVLYRQSRHELLKRLCDVRRALDQNANQLLALEHLFIS